MTFYGFIKGDKGNGLMNIDPKYAAAAASAYGRRNDEEGMYKEFDATELYCPKCKQAVPVRKRLLLVLPDGEKYEYLCAYCSVSIGSKIDKKEKPITLIV